MADNNLITDGIKKLVLAGIGAAAMSAEKADEIVTTLVEKGELTVDQGKELNKELKRTYEERKNGGEKDMDAFVDGLSEEELKKLKEALKNKK